MHGRIVVALLLVAGMAGCMPAVAADAACPPGAPVQPAPEYPREHLWRLARVEVDIILTVDACGVVTDATVERNTGPETFAALAVRSAKASRLAAQAGPVRRFRLPYHFHPVPDALHRRDSERVRDPFFEQRRSSQATMPTPGADGTLPGYIADRYPIGYFSLGEALISLRRHALPLTGPDGLQFWLWDAEGLSLFELSAGMLVRNRQVTDGAQAWVVTSVLCDGDAGRCRAGRARLAAREPQRPHPPLRSPTP